MHNIEEYGQDCKLLVMNAIECTLILRRCRSGIEDLVVQYIVPSMYDVKF